MDAVAISHSGGDLDIDRAGSAHPSLTRAFLAWIRNDRAVTMAGRAGLAGADIAEEGALHGDNLAAPLTGITGHRFGTGLSTLALAFRTDHCGVDFQRCGDAKNRLGEAEAHSDQGVLATAVSYTHLTLPTILRV